jgi:hypothetical protein
MEAPNNMHADVKPCHLGGECGVVTCGAVGAVFGGRKAAVRKLVNSN